MLPVVEHGLLDRPQIGVLRKERRAPRTGVPVVLREVAPRDLDPDAMSCVEDVRRREEVDVDRDRFARDQRRLAIGAVAETRADDALGDRDAPSRRLGVDELDDEVGVGSGRSNEEPRRDGAREGQGESSGAAV